MLFLGSRLVAEKPLDAVDQRRHKCNSPQQLRQKIHNFLLEIICRNTPALKPVDNGQPAPQLRLARISLSVIRFGSAPSVDRTSNVKQTFSSYALLNATASIPRMS